MCFGHNHEEEEYCAFADKNCDDNKISNKWIINNDFNEIIKVKKEKNNKISKKMISLSNKVEPNIIDVEVQSPMLNSSSEYRLDTRSNLNFPSNNSYKNLTDEKCMNLMASINNFWEYNLIADGDCFFHGIILFARLNNWNDIPIDVLSLRNAITDEMLDNFHSYIGFYDASNYNYNLDYFSHLRKFRSLSKDGGPWADIIHIHAFCNKFKSQIIIFKRRMHEQEITGDSERKFAFF